jgi:DNA-binding MarR family transcriptional regulator
MYRIDQFIKGVQILRSVSDDMSVRQVAILSTIYHAKDEGITQTEIAEVLQIPQAAVSRNIKAMSRFVNGTRDEDPEIRGLDLITCRPDLYEPRRLNCTLTKRGQSLMDMVLKCFEE